MVAQCCARVLPEIVRSACGGALTIGRGSARHGLGSANFGRDLSTSVRSSTEFGPISAAVRLSSTKVVPASTRSGPMSTGLGPTFTSYGQDSAKLGHTSTGAGDFRVIRWPLSTDIGRHRPMLDPHCPILGQAQLNRGRSQEWFYRCRPKLASFGQNRADVGQTWAWFGQIRAALDPGHGRILALGGLLNNTSRA